jgi:tetratricopeptide (TPR) repeat protein
VADVIQEARRLTSQGHADRALQVAVDGYRETHDQVLAEFVSAARSAAAKSASDAAAEASGPDVTSQRAYADAAAKFQQAAALTSVDDAPRAVALYAEAEKAYRAAVTASSNDPAIFVRRAADAYQKGAVDRAVEYALTARRLDPAHTAADRIIETIRRDAVRETARARAAAVSAGAASTAAFAQADKRAKDASRNTSADDLQSVVTANKEAVQLYRSAVTSAESARTERHATAERHAAQARVLISQKRYDDADAELSQATALEPQNATAQAVAKQLADARLAARITALVEQSRGVDARQAVALLQQASGLDPSRDDVKRELQRRTDELNARPPAGSGGSNPPPVRDAGAAARAMRDADAAAIRQVLDRYKSAWEAIDVGAIQAVYPTVNAKALRDSFKNVRSQPMTLQTQPPDFDAAGTSATVRCHISSRIEVRAGSPIRLDRDAIVHVDKAGGGWRIARIDYQ